MRELEYAFAPASPRSISSAMAGLADVTAHPKESDAEAAIEGAKRLTRMLYEFPADVALEAINDWPKTPNGKWWPTEAELRAECEKRVDYRRRLKKQVEDAQRAVQRGAHNAKGEVRRLEPHGATTAFYAAVESKYGHPYAFSWLNRRNCDFTDAKVYTTDLGCERLKAQCSYLAKAVGVTIERCKQVEARFHASFAK
jgi:uncharacterized protein YbaA (DUF1428 family)